ncbi:MAG: hypothetical protein ACXWPM_09370 [Bdellovibrionota bacterium]
MKKEKSSYLVWLVLGAMELVAASGCSGTEASASASPSASQAPIELPVRISRAFFEKSMVGEIHIRDLKGSETFSAPSSSVDWREDPTTLPAPGPGAIADFRDFQGCAEFSGEAEGVELCFNVMPDVSSVGVNAKDTKVQGLESLFGTNVTSKFLSAAKTASGGYQIHFLVSHAEGDSDLSLTLQSL